jgi:hypothetical protein
LSLIEEFQNVLHALHARVRAPLGLTALPVRCLKRSNFPLICPILTLTPVVLKSEFPVLESESFKFLYELIVVLFDIRFQFLKSNGGVRLDTKDKIHRTFHLSYCHQSLPGKWEHKGPVGILPQMTNNPARHHQDECCPLEPLALPPSEEIIASPQIFRAGAIKRPMDRVDTAEEGRLEF